MTARAAALRLSGPGGPPAAPSSDPCLRNQAGSRSLRSSIAWRCHQLLQYSVLAADQVRFQRSPVLVADEGVEILRQDISAHQLQFGSLHFHPGHMRLHRCGRSRRQARPPSPAPKRAARSASVRSAPDPTRAIAHTIFEHRPLFGKSCGDRGCSSPSLQPGRPCLAREPPLTSAAADTSQLQPDWPRFAREMPLASRWLWQASRAPTQGSSASPMLLRLKLCSYSSFENIQINASIR